MPASSFREQEGELRAQAPIRGPFRLDRVVATSYPEAHRLVADLEHLGNLQVDRQRQLVVRPVVGRFRVERDAPAPAEIVRRERLDEGLADIRAAARSGIGLDVVGEQPDRPRSLLGQDHTGRTRTPFLRAQAVVRGGRPQEGWTYAPDQPARRGLQGERKKLWVVSPSPNSWPSVMLSR